MAYVNIQQPHNMFGGLETLISTLLQAPQQQLALRHALYEIWNNRMAREEASQAAEREYKLRQSAFANEAADREALRNIQEKHYGVMQSAADRQAQAAEDAADLASERLGLERTRVTQAGRIAFSNNERMIAATLQKPYLGANNMLTGVPPDVQGQINLHLRQAELGEPLRRWNGDADGPMPTGEFNFNGVYVSPGEAPALIERWNKAKQDEKNKGLQRITGDVSTSNPVAPWEVQNYKQRVQSGEQIVPSYLRTDKASPTLSSSLSRVMSMPPAIGNETQQMPKDLAPRLGPPAPPRDQLRPSNAGTTPYVITPTNETPGPFVSAMLRARQVPTTFLDGKVDYSSRPPVQVAPASVETPTPYTIVPTNDSVGPFTSAMLASRQVPTTFLDKKVDYSSPLPLPQRRPGPDWLLMPDGTHKLIDTNDWGFAPLMRLVLPPLPTKPIR